MRYKQAIDDAATVIESHAAHFDDLAESVLKAKGMRENPADKIIAKKYRDKAATIRAVLPEINRLKIHNDAT